MGVAWPLAGKSYFQSSLPVSESNARRPLSIAAAVNTTPPAVTIAPPSVIVPVFIPEIKLPRGTSQIFFPSKRSTAATVPQGGALQGSPLGASSGVRNIANGAPVCRANSPCSRSRSLALFRASAVHSADVAGEDQRALQTRRSENFPASRGLDSLRAPLFLLRVFPPRILRRQFLRNQGNRRSRLRRPGLLSRDIALRHWAFLNGEERSTGESIENENAAHLGGDGNGGRAIFPREERGLRSHVVIPEIVVNHLKAPHEIASAGAESYHRVGPFVIAFADAAVIIGAGAAGGDENQI